MARRPPPPLRVRIEWVRVPPGSMADGLIRLAAIGRRLAEEEAARKAQAAPTTTTTG